MITNILNNKKHYIYLAFLSFLGSFFLIKGIPLFLIVVAVLAYDLIRGKNTLNLPLLFFQTAAVLELVTWIITILPCSLSIAGAAFMYLGSEIFLLITGALYALSTKYEKWFKGFYKFLYLTLTYFCLISFVLALFKLQDTRLDTREELFTGQTLLISPAGKTGKDLTTDHYELSLAASRHSSHQHFILYESASGFDSIIPEDHPDYVLSAINNTIAEGEAVGFLTAESKEGQLWYIRQDPEQGFYIVPAYDESLYLTPSTQVSYNGDSYFELSTTPYYYSFSREYTFADYYWAFWAEGLR